MIREKLRRHGYMATIRNEEKRKVVHVSLDGREVYVACIAQHEKGSAHVDRALQLCELIERRISQGQRWLFAFWGQLPAPVIALLQRKPYALCMDVDRADGLLVEAIVRLSGCDVALREPAHSQTAVHANAFRVRRQVVYRVTREVLVQERVYEVRGPVERGARQ